MFVGIILTLAAIALCGLVATLKVERSA
jgi:hypothetical protein